MKLFGIFGRRFLYSNSRSLTRNFGLLLTASTATYLSYKYLQSPLIQMPLMAEALPSKPSVDPYSRTRQGLKMDRHE